MSDQLALEVAKTQFFTRLTACGASSYLTSDADVAQWQLAWSRPQPGRWRERLGKCEDLDEDERTETGSIMAVLLMSCRGCLVRSVSGGVASQKVLIYPVNEAFEVICFAA